MSSNPKSGVSRLPLKSGLPTRSGVPSLNVRCEESRPVSQKGFLLRNPNCKSVPDLTKEFREKSPQGSTQISQGGNLPHSRLRATKRPAVAGSQISHGGKRPLLQANQLLTKQPTGSKVPGKGALASRNQSNATKPTSALSKPGHPKPKPWDTKGQLELEKIKVLDLQEKVQSFETAMAESQAVSAENENLKKSLDQRIKELETASKKLEGMEKLLSHNKHLEEGISKLQGDLSVLTEEKEILQAKIDKSNLLIYEMNQSLHNLQSALQDKNTSIDNIKSSLADKELMCSSYKYTIEKLKDDLFQLERVRKKMHNQIMDMKGNIRVYCRVRPPLTSEETRKEYSINYPSLESIEIQPAVTETKVSSYSSSRLPDKKTFTLNRVFRSSTQQEEIFCYAAELVQSVLDGFNVCVLAYGITGSGKTHTMEGGDNENRGIIPRAIEAIFDGTKKLKELGWDFTISISCFEVYNEEIRDLADSSNHGPFEIRNTSRPNEGPQIHNLLVTEVKTADKVFEILKIAQKNRSVAATIRNKYSSRSHSITKVDVRGENTTKNEAICSSLYLVDLAGSEKLDDKNGEERTKETTKINLSLSQLRTVINQLASGTKIEQIDYRSSKLTYILKPCLGGNAKTLVLVTLSPMQENFTESVSSLRFAISLCSCKQQATRQVKASH